MPSKDKLTIKIKFNDDAYRHEVNAFGEELPNPFFTSESTLASILNQIHVQFDDGDDEVQFCTLGQFLSNMKFLHHFAEHKIDSVKPELARYIEKTQERG